MEKRSLALISSCSATIFLASSASAQALRTHLEKLEEAEVGKAAVNTFHQFIFSPTTTYAVMLGFAGAIFFYSQGRRRSAIMLALISSLIIVCRYLTELISSPKDFALYIVLPLFLAALALRLNYSLKKSLEDEEERRDKVRERRPRTIKVRSIVSDDEEDTGRKSTAPVKLNRPFR